MKIKEEFSQRQIKRFKGGSIQRFFGDGSFFYPKSTINRMLIIITIAICLASIGNFRNVKGDEHFRPMNNAIRANNNLSYVELVLVIDNDIYKEMNQSLKQVHEYSKDLIDIVNLLFMPLNVFVALVNVVVWTEKNQIELSSNGKKTLKNFLKYRKNVLSKVHPNDNAHLLTKQRFSRKAAGHGTINSICTIEKSGGISTSHSSINVVATTMAHELAHNFGLKHDTKDCKCPDAECIMSTVTRRTLITYPIECRVDQHRRSNHYKKTCRPLFSETTAPKHWSDCSIHQFDSALHQGMKHCLRNIPKRLFESLTCGDGFVDIGEECDCGLPGVCKNICCDPETCKFKSKLGANVRHNCPNKNDGRWSWNM